MKRLFLKAFKKATSVSLLTVMMLQISAPLMAEVSGSVFAAYTFNSTNELNKNKQVPGRIGQPAPYVDFASSEPGKITLKFINPNNYSVCFEYRTDGDTSQALPIPNPNTGLDDRYPSKCITNTTIEETFLATDFIEIRSTFGAERDWDFDWTQFNVSELQAPSNLRRFNPANSQTVACGAYHPRVNLLPQWDAITDPNLSHYEYSSFNLNGTPGIVSQNIGTVTQYTHNWVAPTDGAGYRFAVRAVDTLGNKSAWADCAITYDSISPVVSNIKMYVNNIEAAIAQPGDQVKVEADVIDQSFSGIQKVQIWFREFVAPYDNQLSAGEMTHLSGNRYRYEFTLPSTYSDGDPLNTGFELNYFNFRPWDLANNSAIGWRNNFTIAVELDAPTLISPISGSAFKTTDLPQPQTWGTVAGAVKYFYESCKSDPVLSGGVCPVEDLQYTAETTSTNRNIGITAPEGKYWWRVRAIDSYGFMGAWSNAWVFTVDNSAPDVEVTNPADLSTVAGTIDIRGTVSDANLLRYYYKITGPSGIVTSRTVYRDSSFTDELIYTWDTTTVENGEYTIQLEARDKLNQKDSGSVDSVKVTVFNDMEVGTPTITSPTNNQYFNTLTIRSEWTEVVDPSGINKYEIEYAYTLEGIPTLVYREVPGTQQYRDQLLSGDVQGEFVIRVRAYDNAGNVGDWSEPVNYTFDNIAPLADITNIEEGDTLSAEVNIAGLIKETNLRNYNFAIYGVPEGQTCSTVDRSLVNNFALRLVDINNLSAYLQKDTPISGQHSFAYTWDSANEENEFEDGYYLLRFAARDMAMNRNPMILNDSSYEGYSIEVVCVEIDNIDDTPEQPEIPEEPETPEQPQEPEQEESETPTNSEPTNPSVQGASTTSGNQYTGIGGGTGNPALAFNFALRNGDSSSNENDSDVLGAQTCEVKRTVSGFIYNDSDNDGQIDDDEKLYSDTDVTVYTETSEGSDVLFEEVDTVKTNDNGKWEIELCPGDYKAMIELEELSDDEVLENDEVEFTVNNENDLNNINFLVKATDDEVAITSDRENDNDENDSFNWWWIVLIVIALLLAGYGFKKYQEREI